MTKVKDILEIKGSDVISVTPDTSVLEALKIMAKGKIGTILVMEQEKLLGIFSERDFSRKVILAGKTADIPISEVMTQNVYYVSADRTTEECLVLMTDKHIRHLPVVDGKKVIGVLSVLDLAKDVIKDQEILITSLENFITSREFNL